MRIISGKFKNRRLKTPQGDNTRPTTDRVREAIFSLLYSRMDLAEAKVLDLFSGTAALGLEALSRGAKHVNCIDNQSSAIRLGQENAEGLGILDACSFQRSDAVAYLEKYQGQPFDLIFADPPYAHNRLPDFPDLAIKHLNDNGYLVLEHDRRHKFMDHPNCDTSRAYGRTTVSLFTTASNEQDER